LSLLVLARDENGQPIPNDLLFENAAGLLFAGFDVSFKSGQYVSNANK